MQQKWKGTHSFSAYWEIKKNLIRSLTKSSISTHGPCVCVCDKKKGLGHVLVYLTSLWGYTTTSIETIKSTHYDIKKKLTHNSSKHTSVLLFLCQCCNFSCWVRLGVDRSSFCVDPFAFWPTENSSSWIVLQSNGLHSPKSESLKCPYLSSNKLSGLISLQNEILKKIYDVHLIRAALSAKRKKN